MKRGPENDHVRLGHMLTAARLAVQLVGGETRETAATSLQLDLALRYVVQTIGEAANNLTDEAKRNYDHIPWLQIVGMRHRLVHHYSAVSFDVLWDTVIVDIPALIVDLQRIVADDLSQSQF